MDEPELGLHPYAITVLASLVKQASVDTQIVLATQSSLLLDHFSPDNVLVADRVRGRTELRRLESTDLELTDYSLGQLWEKTNSAVDPFPKAGTGRNDPSARSCGRQEEFRQCDSGAAPSRTRLFVGVRRLETHGNASGANAARPKLISARPAARPNLRGVPRSRFFRKSCPAPDLRNSPAAARRV